MIIEKNIPFHRILLISIFNGFIAMVIAFIVIAALAFLVSFLITWDLNKAAGYLSRNLDIFIIAFIVGHLFEVTDRVIRGKRKNKIISIIRDKDERW